MRVEANLTPAQDGSNAKVATFCRRLYSMPNAKVLLGCGELVWRPQRRRDIDAVVHWADDCESFRRAMRFARKHKIPLWTVTDGFLPALEPVDRPLALALEDADVHGDGGTWSRLQRIFADRAVQFDATLLARANAAIQFLRTERLATSSAACLPPPQLPSLRNGPRILVVDESINGPSGKTSSAAMLRAVRTDHPEAQLVVYSGTCASNSGPVAKLLGEEGQDTSVVFARDSCDVVTLLESVDRVYTVASQIGFDALLYGKEVTCFGNPFYAGWGLTDDRCPGLHDKGKATLSELFALTYFLYLRYLDPDTFTPCTLETALQHLALQRSEFRRNTGRIFCAGFYFWKRKYVRAYLRSPGNEVHFVASAENVKRLGFDSDSHLLVWGQRADAQFKHLASRYGVDIWRMEDGFLRSVGLGSDATVPASLVVDRQGLYYDPHKPSELETILQTAEFSPALVERGKALRLRIQETRLSKYNVGRQEGPLKIDSGGKTVILVPGQVEDDESILRGTVDVCRNLELLAAARKASPEAYIVFKPHPDVASGNRKGMFPASEALVYCDQVIVDATLATCLDAADEVHTMTSLVGFEALLRGLVVHTYGLPFYAGWGLTHDRHRVERRTRRLTMDELTCGVYLLYPRYLNRDTYRFTTAEGVVSQLESERSLGKPTLRSQWLHRKARKVRNMAEGLLRG